MSGEKQNRKEHKRAGKNRKTHSKTKFAALKVVQSNRGGGGHIESKQSEGQRGEGQREDDEKERDEEKKEKEKDKKKKRRRRETKRRREEGKRKGRGKENDSKRNIHMYAEFVAIAGVIEVTTQRIC